MIFILNPFSRFTICKWSSTIINFLVSDRGKVEMSKKMMTAKRGNSWKSIQV